jgi:putative hydrolase of the HAD superfamily
MPTHDAVGQIRGVLFDFGNTLFAHDPLHMTITGCAARLGATVSDEQAAALAHRIDAAAMTLQELAHPRDLDSAVWKQRWQALYGIADDLVDGLGAAVDTAMHDPLAWIPYRHAAATLRALRTSGVAVGIVSNTGWDVRAAFTAHSMSDSVTSFTLSYEAGAAKPDRLIFDVACKSLGLEPEELVMVGDDPRADSGAATAGIRTLLLPGLLPGADNGVDMVLDLLGIRNSLRHPRVRLAAR